MAGIRQPHRTGEGLVAAGPPRSPGAEPLAAGLGGSPALAGRLVRFASLVYEGILLVPVLFLAAYLFLAVAQDARTGLAHALFQVWLVLACGSYFACCWVKGGRTLPMKTWHLRVARSDGSALGWARAWLRYALALCGLLFFGAGFWWTFIDRDRQFLHDRLAGTRVFRLNASPAAGSSPPPAG